MKEGSHECAGPISSIVANRGRNRDLNFLTNEINNEKKIRHLAIIMEKKHAYNSIIK